MTTPSTAAAVTRRRLSPWCRALLLIGIMGIVLPVLAVGRAGPTTTAHAFDLDTHEAILRTALVTAMSGDALDEVTNYGIAVPGANLPGGFPLPELSNLALAPGASLHGLPFEQLWDNAPTPDVICQRLATVTSVLQFAVDQAAPQGTAYKELTDGKRARRAFGLAAVLLANFYAHSNWVELAADRGIMPEPAPLAAGCTPGALPPDLQTGYYDAANAPDGCPKTGGTARPPAPYKFCFSQLSKDAADTGHGAQRATKLAGQPTYHDLAQQLAVGATRQLFSALHTLVVQTYTPESWNADGQCVFEKLTRSNTDPDDVFAVSNVAFQADASCLDLSGVWEITTTVDTGGPSPADLGAVVTIQQERSLANDKLHLYAYFKTEADGADCQLGGTRSSYFDATLDGLNLTGTTSQCLQDDRVLAYCGQTSIYDVEFAGTLDGTGRVRTISGSFTDAGYAIHYDEYGDIVSCEAYPPFDEVYDFSLQRKPVTPP